jgi:hypothetical protein
MTRRTVSLILIGFASLVMLWYMGPDVRATSLLSAWVESTALLVIQLATLAGFLRPGPFQRRLLEVAVPLIVAFLIFDLLLDYGEMRTVLPGYPYAHEMVARYRLRLVVGSTCLACFVVGFLLLIRMRR